MADSTFVRSVAPDLSCPVCLEMFVDPCIPKDLPDCEHVCCVLCLTKLVNQNRCICPECRKTITIPEGGVSKLRTNLKLRNLAEKYPKRPRLEANDKEEPICVEHDDAKMRYYCASCNVLACQACLMVNHKGTEHNIKKIAERYNEIQALTDECQNAVVECGYKKLKSRLEEKVRKQKKEVDELIKDRVNQIKNAGKEIKDQMDAAKVLLLERLNEQKTNHTDLVDSVEKLQSGAKESAGSIPEADFVLRYSPLQKKLETLKAESSKFEMSLAPVAAAHVLPEIKPVICVGGIEEMVGPGKIIDGDKAKSTFAFKFENFMSQLRNANGASGSVYSPPFVFQNIQWRMWFRRNKSDNDSYDFNLGFYLDCRQKLTGTVSYKIVAILKIVSGDGFTLSNRMTGEKMYTAMKSSWGYTQFITSKDLTDKKSMYLENDALIALVEFESVEKVVNPEK